MKNIEWKWEFSILVKSLKIIVPLKQSLKLARLSTVMSPVPTKQFQERPEWHVKGNMRC